MIDVKMIVYDNNIWLAIIAINMTIIGLTSIAETKNIIGIDYGKYLVKRYKVFGFLRMYYLLILFALINIVSLILMFSSDVNARTAIFIVLLISLIFAIYYFFGFILIENSAIKIQILKDELFGLYYESDDATSFEADILAGLGNGWRTNKRLSSNIISYFNNFNSDSQKSFEEAFGPNSILYSRKRSVMNYCKRVHKIRPYNYNIDGTNNHISHEFFQLYRYSDLQEKWLLEILRLFDNNSEDFCILKRINVLRVLAHMNRFGKVENLFGYKFIDYLEPYIIGSISDNNCKISSEKKVEMDKFIINELYIYILGTIKKYEDRNFYKSSLRLVSKLFNVNDQINCLSMNQKLTMLFKLYETNKSTIVEEFLADVYNIYDQNEFQDKISITDIRQLVFLNESHNTNEIIRKRIFNT